MTMTTNNTATIGHNGAPKSATELAKAAFAVAATVNRGTASRDQLMACAVMVAYGDWSAAPTVAPDGAPKAYVRQSKLPALTALVAKSAARQDFCKFAEPILNPRREMTPKEVASLKQKVKSESWELYITEWNNRRQLMYRGIDTAVALTLAHVGIDNFQSRKSVPCFEVPLSALAPYGFKPNGDPRRLVALDGENYGFRCDAGFAQYRASVSQINEAARTIAEAARAKAEPQPITPPVPPAPPEPTTRETDGAGGTEGSKPDADGYMALFARNCVAARDALLEAIRCLNETDKHVSKATMLRDYSAAWEAADILVNAISRVNAQPVEEVERIAA